MNSGFSWLSGLGLGAGLMYLFDPAAGRRRRARLRDKAVHVVSRFEHYLDMAVRDVSHRAQGLVAETRAQLAGGAAPDDVLVERVRSKLGHCVSHPHAIEVKADNGRVTLSGPILEREVAVLLACVTSIRGVDEVENRLEVHRHAGTVPRLQGGRDRKGAEQVQANWPPAARLLACTVGCGLMVNCLARRTPFAALLGTVGFGLFARGLTNLELKHLAEIGGGTRLFGVQGSPGSKAQEGDGRASNRGAGNGKRHMPRFPEMGAEG
jgi:osmotically-inducible protein OsmY